MAKKVLIIEDNTQNRYLFSVLLKHHGYTVIEATTGTEGLKIADKYRPDLILLDIQLPDIDGYEVARKLRVNSALSTTPVVAVTSYAMVGDRQKALEAGCNGYIEKPINPVTFADEIRQILSELIDKR
jgi:two-component system, cell cycle response regulator DivK